MANLREATLPQAAQIAEQGLSETLSSMAYPREQWIGFGTNNPLERSRARSDDEPGVVGALSDGNSPLMLVAARLRHFAGIK